MKLTSVNSFENVLRTDRSDLGFIRVALPVFKLELSFGHPHAFVMVQAQKGGMN